MYTTYVCDITYIHVRGHLHTYVHVKILRDVHKFTDFTVSLLNTNPHKEAVA